MTSVKVCFLKWIWKIQFPAAFWRIKLHRQFLNVETVKSCSFLFINSRNGGCRTLGITSVSMALCPHIMRGKPSGCMHPAPVLLGIERKTCYHSRSGMEDHSWPLPVSFPDGTNWNCVKGEQPQRFQNREWLWCEEGQDAAVSWPRAGQQGGGDVSIVWICMEPHGTMCAQTHWARRRRHGCCTRASQKALNVFLFEKQLVLVKNNIWLKHTSHSFSQFPTHTLQTQNGSSQCGQKNWFTRERNHLSLTPHENSKRILPHIWIFLRWFFFYVVCIRFCFVKAVRRFS